jgi:hypothetical protein
MLELVQTSSYRYLHIKTPSAEPPTASFTSSRRTVRTGAFPNASSSMNFDLIDESKTQLSMVLQTEGDCMTHQYDFGEDWEHEVVLEKIIPANYLLKFPTCLGGERRCPPEDGR